MFNKSTFVFEWKGHTYNAYYSRNVEQNGQLKYLITFSQPNPFPQFGDEPQELFCPSYGKFCCTGSNDMDWIYFKVNLMQWLKKHLEKCDDDSLTIRTTGEEHLPLDH